MVFGNLSTGYWLGAAAAAGLHWVELGRTTLSGTSDNIAVTSLATKPYIMILSHNIVTSDHNMTWSTGTGSYSGSYSDRRSENGGSDSTTTSRSSNGIISDAHTKNMFTVGDLLNTDGQEKLVSWSVVGHNDDGAGNAPDRFETVGKFTGTSQINQIKLNNSSSINNEIGSEVVVLGCDPDDTEGTSVWEELKSVELGSSGDSLDTGTFTAKKYLWVQIKRNRTGSVNSRIQVNGDTGSNYALRYDGGAGGYGADSTSINQTSIFSHAATSNESFTNYFIINKADKEKLIIIEEVNGAAAGAGNAPDRAEVVAKWTNTSDQITSIQCINTDSGDLTSGTSIKVWGFD